MNVVTPLSATQHPFLTGKPKRLFIGGKWVQAASGKTFDTLNPSTGEVLAAVAEGDREDIDRAVDAARRAFDGPWRKFKPFERQNLLLKLADLVEQHFDELASLEPAGVVADGPDRVLLVDTGNHRIDEYRVASKQLRTWAH